LALNGDGLSEPKCMANKWMTVTKTKCHSPARNDTVTARTPFWTRVPWGKRF